MTHRQRRVLVQAARACGRRRCSGLQPPVAALPYLAGLAALRNPQPSSSGAAANAGRPKSSLFHDRHMIRAIERRKMGEI